MSASSLPFTRPAIHELHVPWSVSHCPPDSLVNAPPCSASVLHEPRNVFASLLSSPPIGAIHVPMPPSFAFTAPDPVSHLSHNSPENSVIPLPPSFAFTEPNPVFRLSHNSASNSAIPVAPSFAFTAPNPNSHLSHSDAQNSLIIVRVPAFIVCGH